MLKINEQFRALIPPLTEDEFITLKQSCISEGIRDAIITWNEYIIDGHNRYEIAQANNLPFRTDAKEFESETDVKVWMIYNQFGRRNLSNYQRSVLALELEGIFRDKARDNLSKAGKSYSLKQPLQNSAKVDKTIDTRKELAKVANVSHDTIQRVKIIEEKAPEEVKVKLRTGEVSINQAYQDIRKDEKKAELVQKKLEYIDRIESKTESEFKVDIYNTNERFRVIYADPAWSYNDKQDTPQLGGAVKHYGTMTTKQICELPVSLIAEKNSVLFLWVTSPLLEDAFLVINEWGFKYKSSFIWDKVKHNMGHYNSVRHELLLIATKGSCVPDNKKLYDSVQSIERNDNHSEKPIEFLDIIDDIYTFGNKLEMFCREIKKDNWHGWGNEI